MQDTELPEKIEPTSLNFQTELAAQLAELVPEAMSDGKLDVTKLREMVNGDAENSPEKFGLFWPGKRAAQALAQIPTTATLIPAPEESVDWDKTKNIFIEGDNLEVLKALQNSYRRKVKMIYIDPPYNTGKEFIYPDKFSEGLQGYLEYTGQKNEVGENTESKPETGGRKHSNWLSMMYPRLQLAKSLLTDDGVIFISIDDNEQSNLKKQCDEVFGEDNHIATFVWEGTGKNDSHYISVAHDYVLAYSRSMDALKQKKPLWRQKKKGVDKIYKQVEALKHTFGNDYARVSSELKAWYTQLNKTDEAWAHRHYNHVDENGIFFASDISWPGGGGPRYEVLHPITKKPVTIPSRGWVFSKPETMMQKVVEDKVFFGENELKVPTLKTYLHETEGTVAAGVIYKDRRSAKQKLVKLMGGDYFETPKDVGVIRDLIELATDRDDIVIDFFSGSGTTAESVMELNMADDGIRRHIQVQLPEPTPVNSEAYKAGYKTIADISKERIRRSGKKITEEYADKITKRAVPLDTGFRVYKLAPSNFLQWDENKAKDDIQQSVLDFAANKKPDATPEALLTEIVLQARMPLSANIEKRDLQSGGWVYVVDGGNLIAYVANEQITEAQANEIAELAPAKLIVLDSAFNGNNALKINVANICKEKFIKEFRTI